MIAGENTIVQVRPNSSTPGAIEALEQVGQTPWEFVALHAAGDWGVVGAEDAEANNEALKDGSRLLSAYILKDGKNEVVGHY